MGNPEPVTPARRDPSRRWRAAVIFGSGSLALVVLAGLLGWAVLRLPSNPGSPWPPTGAPPAGASGGGSPGIGVGPPTPSEGTIPGGAPASLAAQVRPLPAATDPPTATSGPVPIAISFPAIGVERSPIDGVGVEANGEMEVPPPRRVGWYRYGARPGQPGSTVLAAHIAADGIDGVFRHLDGVTAGERFEVVLDDGTTLTYEVVEQAQYDKTELPFDRAFARTGPSTMTLITCGGPFQPSLRSYQDNVVVYAVLAED